MKALLVIKEIVEKIKDIGKVLLGVVPPVAGIMIGSDLLFGTTFGVLTRLQSMLAAVGLSGNILTVLIVSALVIWYSEKKKA